MPEQPNDIHLSVVATSRNDNHGGSLTQRMQHFVDGFVAQCERHGLRSELILVEWNPPEDRRPLYQELKWPDDPAPCEIRIITVPPEVHRTFQYADKLPLFQMIAKNVGIRRARGKFVLATNIDILFSDEVIRLMRDRLLEGRLYRAPRCDIPGNPPRSESFDDVLAFCKREMFRVNANGCTAVRDGPKWSQLKLLWLRVDPRLRYLLHIAVRLLHTAVRLLHTPVRLPHTATHPLRRAARLAIRPLAAWRAVWRRFRAMFQGLRQRQRSLVEQRSLIHRIRARLIRHFELFVERLIRPWSFTNACGDFTLLSRNDWFRLRAYPEWHIFSWHLDSILLYQATASGLREVDLGLKAAIFHIEHETGSGYTPEGAEKLFTRLRTAGLPFLANQDLARLAREMRSSRDTDNTVTYNPLSWGLCGVTLPEITIRSSHDRGGSETRASLATS